MKPQKKFTLLVWAVFLLVNEVRSQSITNWGESVNGVQMSIALSNSVFSVGSLTAIECVVKNSSSSLVVFAGDPDQDMQIILVAESGTIYNLSRFPSSFHPGGGPGVGLQAKEIKNYSFPIAVAKDFEPGSYKIKAEIKIRMPLENTNQVTRFSFRKVVSNSVALQIN